MSLEDIGHKLGITKKEFPKLKYLPWKKSKKNPKFENLLKSYLG